MSDPSFPDPPFAVTGGGGDDTDHDLQEAHSDASDDDEPSSPSLASRGLAFAKKAAASALSTSLGTAGAAAQKIGEWMKTATAAAPSTRLGVAGALLGALVLWKAGGAVHSLLNRSQLPTVLYVDKDRSVDMDKVRRFSTKYLQSARTPSEFEVENIIPAVDAKTRGMWLEYYRAQKSASSSDDISLESLREFRKELVTLVRAPPAPDPPKVFILRTPRVHVVLQKAHGTATDSWPISPIEWLFEKYKPRTAIWEAKAPHVALQQYTPEEIREDLIQQDSAYDDGSSAWVLVPPTPDYAYPVEPLWTTQTPCPPTEAGTSRQVTFWTERKASIDPSRPLRVRWTQDGGAAQEATTTEPGKTMAGNGVVQWTVALKPPCLEPNTTCACVFEIFDENNTQLDRLEWTVERKSAEDVRDTAYITFSRLEWAAWRATPEQLRQMVPTSGSQIPWSEVTFQTGQKDSTRAPASLGTDGAAGEIISENVQTQYGDQGGPFLWNFVDEPWSEIKQSDTYRAPPLGWSSEENAQEYRDANLRLFTLLHMQRALRPALTEANRLMELYHGLDLANSRSDVVQEGCQLRSTLQQALQRTQFLQASIDSCLDAELQSHSPEEYRALYEIFPKTSNLERQNQQLQRQVEELKRAISEGRTTTPPVSTELSPSPRAHSGSSSRRPRRAAALPAPANGSALHAWLGAQGQRWTQDHRNIRNQSAASSARMHVLGKLLQQSPANMPLNEEDLVHMFTADDARARNFNEIPIFGLEPSGRRSGRDTVVYVNVAHVPGHAALCTSADTSGACFSTRDKIGKFFHDAAARLSWQGSPSLSTRHPLLLFWLGQVMSRIPALWHNPNLFALPQHQSFMLSQTYYNTPNAVKTAVRWLYATDKALRGRVSSARRAALVQFMVTDTQRQTGGWRFWMDLSKALERA